MKHVIIVFAVMVTVLLSGCGIHLPYVANLNQSVTNVELSEGNFKVVKTVSGEAEAQYILGFGGLKKRSLLELAKKEMFDEAQLDGKSAAITNITVEEYIQNYVVLVRRKVVVTGQVVEFTK